jgi:predicted NUDIX family phosphoesterase
MEFVLVIKRYDLFDRSFPYGFVARGEGSDGPEAGHSVQRWTDRIREKSFFIERRHAELDSSFKQIIPYTMVMHGDEILLLKRLDAGGEKRLHGKLSIGVGGHINPVDTDADAEADVLDAGCRRELEEEINIRAPYTLEPVGAINDDASDVGSVHFGLVNIAHCETADVVIRETHMMEGSFVSRSTLADIAAKEPERFETWSTLIIARLDELLA